MNGISLLWHVMKKKEWDNKYQPGKRLAERKNWKYWQDKVSRNKFPFNHCLVVKTAINDLYEISEQHM